jgi:hypothetical protein
VPGFSKYHASSTGQLKTFNWKNKGVERIMKPALDSKGYFRTMLKSDSGVFKTVKVHRIIADTFLESDPARNEVNHKDGNKQNNCVENIEWSNRSENIKHAFDNGLCLVAGRKVRNDETGKIYLSCSEAARYLNVPKSTLQSMLSGYRKNKTSLVYL